MHIFYRTCKDSSISKNKNRPDWFSREVCLHNLISRHSLTFGDRGGELHIVTDGPSYDIEHLVAAHNKVPSRLHHEIQAGSGGESFAQTVELALSIVKDPEEIIYFVEDDYMHMGCYDSVIEEGFQIPDVAHVTLFDHADKYFLPEYHNLRSKIYHTKKTHWRTTPSTTDTFAVKLGTLQKHKNVYIQYSRGKFCSQDHQRFLHLNDLDLHTISSIPGYATHCETDYLSPTIDWNNLTR